MAAPLLQTKFYVPPVRAGLVPRPRLIQRLDEGLCRKLTLISAPAGFGKTTLLSEWIGSAAGSPEDQGKDASPTAPAPRFAWLSLDEGDNDPARFLACLIAALQKVEVRIGNGMLSALRASHPQPPPPPIEELLTTLINQVNALVEVSAAPVERPAVSTVERPAARSAVANSGTSVAREARRDLVLVLDDYHLITAQPVHAGLGFLLDHLPVNMHLVIATRADPPLHLPRLRGRGQLTEVRAFDLRFTTGETTALMNDVMALDLSPGDVDALAVRTEGWIASLQMAALSMRGGGWARGGRDPSDFVRAFTGSHHFILDYLVEEVLNKQPPAIQKFLTQTAILARLTGPLCDFVTGREGGNSSAGSAADGRVTLETLERANLFILPLDDERRWYRYHHLFADLLRARLRQQVGVQGVASLHRRASQWYEQDGQLDLAIEHALSAEDFQRAARLIELAAETTLMRGEFATVLGWIEALPEALLQARPLLCAYDVLMLIFSGRPLEQIQTRLQETAKGDEADLVSGEVAMMRAVLATFQGELTRGMALSEQALALLPEENSFLRGFVARNLGSVYLLTGQIAAATRTFEEVVRLDRQTGNLLGIVADLQRLAFLRTLQGQLYRAQEIYQEALDLAVNGQGRRLPVATKVLIGLGDLFYQWDDLEAAERYFIEAIELARRWAEVWGLGGYIFLARVRQAQGDVADAREAIRTAEQLALAYDIMEIDDLLVYAYQARLWVAQGDLAAAAGWVERRGLEREAGAAGAGNAYHLHEIEQTTLARIYVAQGRPDEALAVLESLLPAAKKLGRTGSVIEVLALQALALYVRGDVAPALDRLTRALALAEPGGYVRLFVDEGESMAELLARVTGPERAYARRLLAAFPARSAFSVDDPDDSTGLMDSTDLIEPLSAREQEVLGFLATHLSSTEIAEELFIAPSTVRTHIKNIYGKLQVHSRTEAVQRAEKLRLL